ASVPIRPQPQPRRSPVALLSPDSPSRATPMATSTLLFPVHPVPSAARSSVLQQQQPLSSRTTSCRESKEAVAGRNRDSVDRLLGSLQLDIPSGASSSGVSSKISPGAASACSLSSYDGCSSLEHGQSTAGGAPVNPLSMAPPIVIRKGPFGFGFTIKSVRVYLGEHSDYYTIEHIVSSVDERGPAFEAGLRCEDMITSVNAQPVHNMTHPQLMNAEQRMRNRTEGDSSGRDGNSRGRAEKECGKAGKDTEAAKVSEEETAVREEIEETQ
ncbi:hypothetical protein PMAYCL1PPCAC_05117, partial [Pristionchus mayeri]